MRIAYVGFVQRGETRFFHFDGIVERRPGQIAQHTHMLMTADMAIVSRLHVKYQDLPALCLKTLSAVIGNIADNDRVPGSYALTEADVHAWSKPPAEIKLRPRKAFPHKPAPRSQFAWPKKEPHPIA